MVPSLLGERAGWGKKALLDLLLDPLASSLLEQPPSLTLSVHLMGRKRLFLHLGIPSNQRPAEADPRGEGRTLALPRGEALVQLK